MRMRRFLTASIGSQVAEVRDDLRSDAQRAVRLNREDRYSPSRVIGRQQILPARMNSHVRRLAARGHRVEEPQVAGLRIDAEGGCAARAGLVSGIEELLGRIQNDEGRAADWRNDTDEGQGIGSRII